MEYYCKFKFDLHLTYINITHNLVKFLCFISNRSRKANTEYNISKSEEDTRQTLVPRSKQKTTTIEEDDDDKQSWWWWGRTFKSQIEFDLSIKQNNVGLSILIVTNQNLVGIFFMRFARIKILKIKRSSGCGDHEDEKLSKIDREVHFTLLLKKTT